MRRTEARKGSKIVKYGGYNKLDQDPRNDLVLRFIEVAAALNPKVIVIENVPQFLSHYHDGKRGGIAQQVEEILTEMGYQVTCGILNAADFGVPQLRQRAVVLASRIGKLHLPNPTHSDPDPLESCVLKPWVTVRDALKDLPQDASPCDNLGGTTEGYVAEVDNSFLQLMRSVDHFPFNHVTRTYKPQIIKIIKSMKPGETWDEASARMTKRYDKLVESAVLRGESSLKARHIQESI